jgi:pimeloyl-ACP methyl ester carboxylesterase
MPKPTIVLVHGAWADGASWNAVSTELQGQGFTVLTPPNLLHGVAGDAAYVASFLAQRTTGPVVLAGHSYGGVVITNAGTAGGDVKALVYVDAFIPDEGQAAGGLVGPDSVLAPALANPAAVFRLVPIPGAPPEVVDTYLLAAVVASSFANDLSAEEVAVIAATQRPASVAGLAEPSGPPAWRSIPAWAVIGREDRIIPPAAQRSMAEHAGARITEVDASHVSMVSRPDVVVEVIGQVLGEIGALQPA